MPPGSPWGSPKGRLSRPTSEISLLAREESAGRDGDNSRRNSDSALRPGAHATRDTDISGKEDVAASREGDGAAGDADISGKDDEAAGRDGEDDQPLRPSFDGSVTTEGDLSMVDPDDPPFARDVEDSR